MISAVNEVFSKTKPIHFDTDNSKLEKVKKGWVVKIFKQVNVGQPGHGNILSYSGLSPHQGDFILINGNLHWREGLQNIEPTIINERALEPDSFIKLKKDDCIDFPANHSLVVLYA